MTAKDRILRFAYAVEILALGAVFIPVWMIGEVLAGRWHLPRARRQESE